ncbi:MAG TPA: hypothetical protein VFB72_01260, partial [Verrucomicrobiae bacterium]|nr:hypothetical protein [Verrucomicrobiae bacterium]
MSTERTLEKRKSMAEVAREIDKISSSAVQQFEDAGDFEKELVVATAVVDMRALLTPEIMAPVMALMNTDLGFRTDRDPKQNDKAGRPLVPYSMDVVRDVFIESRLRGFHAVGNEFNIIAGRFYGCKNGFERKVRELTKGTCEVSIDVPQMMGGTAKVKCRATWAINGQKGDIGVRPEDPCEFLVRINEFMGPDGAIGKAQRKLYQRIYSRLTGKSVPDGDAAEGSIEVSASVTRQPGGAKHHE